MKHTHITSLIGALALMLPGAAALTSCRQGLCYDHFRQSTVSLDFEQEWERDYGAAHASSWDENAMDGTYDDHRPGVPETVTMMVYPTDGAQPYNIFLEAAGGVAPLGAGPYDFLLYNNDTEYIVINDIASLPDAAATTSSRSRASLVPLHRGERTVSPPDVIYGAYHEAVPDVGVHGDHQLTTTLRPLVYTYVIRYEIATGGEHVQLARGALAGMAEKVYLRNGSTGPEAATVLFDCYSHTDGAILAKVATFGVPSFPGDHYGRDGESDDNDNKYTLNLEVRLTDGTMQDFTFDVTDQLKSQPRGGVIRVGGIQVAPPENPDDENWVDSGFNTNVDDWGEWTDVVLPTQGVEIPK